MAKQSSYFKQIYSPAKPQATSMGWSLGIGDPNAGRVVVDPYSNKYYGQESKKSYLSHFDSQIQSLQQTLKSGYHPQAQRDPSAWWSNYSYQAPKKLTEDDIASYNRQIADVMQQRQSFDQNYVQSRDFFASYDAYKNGWDNYFEASYRNPRMEAEQKTFAIEKTEQYKAQVEEANNKAQLTSANQLEIQAPRQVGTGVGAAKDTSINQLLSNGGTGLGL